MMQVGFLVCLLLALGGGQEDQLSGLSSRTVRYLDTVLSPGEWTSQEGRDAPLTPVHPRGRGVGPLLPLQG